MTFNKLFMFDSLESTNDYAKSIAHDATDGTVIVAGIQTRGKGRGENTWSSGPGGLYLSVLLKPDRPIQHTLPLTLITALAVSRTLEGYEVSSSIKWPNDILVEGKKLAGILVEGASAGARLDHVIIGAGINLNNTLPEDLPATSLRQIKNSDIVVTEFRDGFLGHLHSLYNRFLEEGFTDELKDEWVLRAGVEGKQLRERESGELLGRFVGLDDDGGIIYNPPAGGDSMIPKVTHETDIDLV